MRSYLSVFIAFAIAITFSSCKKDAVSVTSANPNIINGCEIVQSQVVQTDLYSQQIRSYVNTFQYDSLGRITMMGDGSGSNTDHYQYHGHDCDGDHNSVWHESADGYILSSTSPNGSYQYSYDGNGYLQLEVYTDSIHQQGHNHSYTESYYWDGNNNMSYSVKLDLDQSTPVTTTYSYYIDKPNQILMPTNGQKGKIASNLISQVIVSSGGVVISTDTYSYIFDTQGKVAQYTDLTAGQTKTVYTLTYSCH